MPTFFISLIAKLISRASRLFAAGAGVTWPGEIALRLDKTISRKLSAQLKHGLILVVGTNGKTTTTALISHILTSQGYRVISNTTGANLQNGIAGTLILKTNFWGALNADFGIFELDEANLPALLAFIQPKILVLLNLFRDQLDRYGEMDTIASNWQKAIQPLKNAGTMLVVNGDDPLMAYIGINYPGACKFFGLEQNQNHQQKLSHASDSTFCLWCGTQLAYQTIYLAHYGNWQCPACHKKRPELESIHVEPILDGTYSLYNLKAAILVALLLNIPNEASVRSLKQFKPVFGRQEEFVVQGKKIKILLSKNPVGLNENIHQIVNKPDLPTVLLILNDRIPDGKDVSWIWDVDFEQLTESSKKIICAGDRAYDLSVRLKYAFSNNKVNKVHQSLKQKVHVFTNNQEALAEGLRALAPNDTLYILPTYSAMLDIRQILTGKKI